MAHFQLQLLPLLPAPAFVLLVVGFGSFAALLALEPGGEESGGGEVGLAVADDLGGGYGWGFVDRWGGGVSGVGGGEGVGALRYRGRLRRGGRALCWGGGWWWWW